MIKTKLTALTLAGLMAVATGSAFAGSTGPTDPIDTTGPRTGTKSMGQDTNGTTPSDKTSTPGTKSMDNNGTTPATPNSAGGMSNGSGMGGNGGGGEGGSGSK